MPFLLPLEDSCPIEQWEMDLALTQLRGEGVVTFSESDGWVITDKLRGFVFNVIGQLPVAERVAILCLSGVCVCTNKEEVDQ